MPGLSYYNLTASDGLVSTAALGQTVEIKGAQYVYVQASAAINAYQVCLISNTFTAAAATAALLTTTKPSFVCIPQFSVAISEYFWAACGPFYLRDDDVTTFKVLSKIAAANVVMYGTTTAGSVDDAVTTPIIQGLTLTASQAVDDTATACIATRRLAVNS